MLQKKSTKMIIKMYILNIYIPNLQLEFYIIGGS